ncbi:prostaglandin E2 receptor EP4 subtype-like [Crassostrea angulata]|uniref:prostaglandin E2 receptor EP4 subtype-like n=1 Tax=Magallana angulata TaxID=2784310 RepID=UPI0022B0D548|nr:prostaglandin E2 receptor EP4 subtype-like [Crassostrea angulata]
MTKISPINSQSVVKMNVTESNSFVSNTTQYNVWESVMPPVLQFAWGVGGNLIALIVLVKTVKSHKWRPFYRFVGGLALTDGGGILLVYPTVMVRYATDFTYDYPETLCNYSSFIFSLLFTSSAMIVCAMSFDRFLAIVYPLKYNHISQKRRRANITLISIWLVGALISSLQLMGLGESFNYYPGSWCFLKFVSKLTMNRVSSYIFSLFGLSILLTTISLNLIVIVTVCRGMNSVNNKQTARRRKKNDFIIIIFLIIVVSVFGVTWAPLMFTMLGHAGKWIHGNGARELLVLRFAVTNAMIDPWIYILLRKETFIAIKRHYKGLCKNLFGKSNIPTVSYTSQSTSNKSGL